VVEVDDSVFRKHSKVSKIAVGVIHSLIKQTTNGCLPLPGAVAYLHFDPHKQIGLQHFPEVWHLSFRTPSGMEHHLEQQLKQNVHLRLILDNQVEHATVLLGCLYREHVPALHVFWQPKVLGLHINECSKHPESRAEAAQYEVGNVAGFEGLEFVFLAVLNDQCRKTIIISTHCDFHRLSLEEL